MLYFGDLGPDVVYVGSDPYMLYNPGQGTEFGALPPVDGIPATHLKTQEVKQFEKALEDDSLFGPAFFSFWIFRHLHSPTQGIDPRDEQTAPNDHGDKQSRLALALLLMLTVFVMQVVLYVGLGGAAIAEVTGYRYGFQLGKYGQQVGLPQDVDLAEPLGYLVQAHFTAYDLCPGRGYMGSPYYETNETYPMTVAQQAYALATGNTDRPNWGWVRQSTVTPTFLEEHKLRATAFEVITYVACVLLIFVLLAFQWLQMFSQLAGFYDVQLRWNEWLERIATDEMPMQAPLRQRQTTPEAVRGVAQAQGDLPMHTDLALYGVPTVGVPDERRCAVDDEPNVRSAPMTGGRCAVDDGPFTGRGPPRTGRCTVDDDDDPFVSCGGGGRCTVDGDPYVRGTPVRGLVERRQSSGALSYQSSCPLKPVEHLRLDFPRLIFVDLLAQVIMSCTTYWIAVLALLYIGSVGKMVCALLALKFIEQLTDMAKRLMLRQTRLSWTIYDGQKVTWGSEFSGSDLQRRTVRGPMLVSIGMLGTLCHCGVYGFGCWAIYMATTGCKCGTANALHFF